MRPSRSAAELIVGGASLAFPRPSSVGGKREKYARPLAARGGARALTTLEFGHAAGDHGLVWDGTLVVKVAAQAQRLGVRPGWRIEAVDGFEVRSGQEVWMRLQEARWQWRSCRVSFATETGEIRAERSLARLAAIRAEEERKAMLPFEGNRDPKHLAQIAEEFPEPGARLPPEQRAVTLEQLRRLLRFAEERCHRWRDPLPESRTAGMKLSMDFMNVLHLHHWLIAPACRERGCCMADLLGGEAQRPAWCVVHWWGDRLLDLLRCLECQASVRGLGKDAGYWLAALAVRPAEGVDAGCARFAKARLAANGRVLLVADQKREESGPCTPPFRLWCACELLVCAEDAKTELDVVAMQAGKTALLMRGFTEEERQMEARQPGSGYRAKTEREKSFSIDIVERCLEVKVQAAACSEAGERARLLNGLAGRDGALPVLEEHEGYLRANKRLAALLSLAFWHRAVAATGNEVVSARLQARMADAIRADLWRAGMDVNMGYCVSNGPEEKLALLTKAFPPNLKELTLDLSGLDIVNENMALLAAALPRELEELTLSFANNPQVDNIGITSFINALPQRQRAVSLQLQGTGVGREFQEKSQQLEGLRRQIVYEAQKGSVCTTLTLSPSTDRRMHMSSTRTKI